MAEEQQAQDQTTDAPAIDAPVEGAAPVLGDAAPNATDAPADTPAEGNAPPEIPANPLPFEPKLPEGITLDPELGAKFLEFVKAKNLTHEEAQALVDLNLQQQAKQAEQYQATQREWIEQSRTDKEFGGEKFSENLAVANKALSAFGTPQIKDLLKSTGFGNHPEVIRMFVKIGNAVADDKLIVRSTDAPGPSDPVSLYPKSNMKK